MEENTKKCPYCGEEIKAVAKKCRHCGEWLNKNEMPLKPGSDACKRFKVNKGIVLNLTLVLLVIANSVVVFLWVRDCSTPKSVKEYDTERIAKIINIKKPTNKSDSISYAIGCFFWENVLDQFNEMDDFDKIDLLAGIIRSSCPMGKDSQIQISQRIQNIQIANTLLDIINKDMEGASNVENFNVDIIFQGLHDNATAGKSPLMDIEESSRLFRSTFK